MAAEEAEKNEQATEETQPKSKSKLGGLIKYAIFGVVGIVAVVGIALGTLMLVGGDQKAASADAAQTSDAHADGQATNNSHAVDSSAAHASDMTEEDSILATLQEDESVIENIMKNLEVLDYKPTDAEMAGPVGMSAEDSLSELSWIETEKAALKEREKGLTKREKELERLNLQVTQKLTRLEQAESVKIAQLAKLYDGMESRSVAKLIANLDDNTVVSILPRMKLKNASQVLSLMPAARAAKLSKQMITIAER